MMQKMKLNNRIEWGCLGLLAMALSGCNTMTSLSVSVLEKGYVCSINQSAGVHLVSDTSAKEADNTRIGASRQKHPETDPASESFWIVRVNMGQKPNGGYGLRLISDNLEISSDRASVALEWLQPKPGSVQIQVLTYPCLYLQIAKGNYSRLDIVDQHGEVRHSLDLK
ncbi:MAG: hypothetical protein B6D72_13130 [gamma proteobacterium symbiont of Ctena orbiculata]|nr:MAG: hypothetical protein DBP00_16265 [gamma proteobacterium symbiont of Ctena orbiculata]PVV10121.1 MAG: hypothetical protein B6D72_13130 [gamma proteobacterium symbiont of Ctena orbiculata]PVV21711.1 MAG: hypothetical protein B6D74_11265 [gamma proteobacterium symbiont of Ctena orbiculata]